MRDLFLCHPHSDLAIPASFVGRKILLVEDNPVNLKVATVILEWLGRAVIAADSGEKAIERLRIERGIDLILMDCQMPGMDGFEATRVIRAMQASCRRRRHRNERTGCLRSSQGRCQSRVTFAGSPQNLYRDAAEFPEAR